MRLIKHPMRTKSCASLLSSGFCSASPSAGRPMSRRKSPNCKERRNSSLTAGSPPRPKGLPWPCWGTARPTAPTRRPSIASSCSVSQPTGCAMRLDTSLAGPLGRFPMAVGNVHHFVIEPLKGVGPIRFGMSKEEVSRAFTYVYTSFFKGQHSKVRADHCEVLGLIIHYDDASRVNYIEVMKAAYATVTLELFGRDITGISVRDLAAMLRPRSPRTE